MQQRPPLYPVKLPIKFNIVKLFNWGAFSLDLSWRKEQNIKLESLTPQNFSILKKEKKEILL